MRRDWFVALVLAPVILVFLVGCSSLYSPVAETEMESEDPDPEELEHIITSHPDPDKMLHKIRTGDLLRIQFYGHDFGGDYKVPPSGKIDFPYVGTMDVTGMTPQQLKQRIQDEMTPEYFPQISLSVNYEEFGKITVRVLGAVEQPKRVELPRNTGVMDALIEAEDITPNTIRDRIFVFRKEDGEVQGRLVDYDRYVQGDLSQNVILRDGDLVYAPVKFWPRIETLDQLLRTMGAVGTLSREVRVLSE